MSDIFQILDIYMLFMRPSQRKENELRRVNIEPGVSLHAEGSCLIEFGDTKVICTASVEEKVPSFLRGSGSGWITAEYGMLPRSTNSRMKRESSNGKQSGRTQEIQRLVGRSLRSVVDLNLLGERQIIVDCDVIQADGGTRTASITGGFVALYLACQSLKKQKLLHRLPIKQNIAAISCGVYANKVVIDLDYLEDSNAEIDANFVITEDRQLVEIQATGETRPFSQEEFNKMLQYALKGTSELIKLQKKIISSSK